jgi:hydroxymethylpyrimidine/phosphomethylpyrimidine kinase
MTPPVALSVAGSDSGGGAGIQADLRSFAAYGVHGTTAITAVTAQDTTGVKDVLVCPARLVAEQMQVVLSDLRPRAAKTGMLANREIVEVVAEIFLENDFRAVVVDPVMVATSGARLATEDIRRSYLERLFPLAQVVTPNLFEAGALLGEKEPSNLQEMAEAARELARYCPGLVVVKGGHLAGEMAVDVVWDGNRIEELASARIATVNTHGTGCSFSAAIAAGMAKGEDPLSAVRSAKRFVSEAIRRAANWSLGAGPGPVDHLGWELP